MIVHRPTPSSNPQNRQPKTISDSAAKIHFFYSRKIFEKKFCEEYFVLLPQYYNVI